MVDAGELLLPKVKTLVNCFERKSDTILFSTIAEFRRGAINSDICVCPVVEFHGHNESGTWGVNGPMLPVIVPTSTASILNVFIVSCILSIIIFGGICWLLQGESFPFLTILPAVEKVIPVSGAAPGLVSPRLTVNLISWRPRFSDSHTLDLHGFETAGRFL